MISSIASFSPRLAAPTPRKSDPEFDLSTIDNAREVYFLPQVDRLAAWIAQQAEQPMRVRVEAEGQVLEYVTTGDPAQTVVASLNGVPFEVSSAPGEEKDSLKWTGHGQAGEVEGDFYKLEDGTQVTGLAGPERMPFNHSLHIVEKPEPQGPVMESRGNFACARMHHEYYAENGHLKVEGELGRHTIDAVLEGGPENGYILQGNFGDLEFKQTFTPELTPPGRP